jgi:hypothetical protein
MPRRLQSSSSSSTAKDSHFNASSMDVRIQMLHKHHSKSGADLNLGDLSGSRSSARSSVLFMARCTVSPRYDVPGKLSADSGYLARRCQNNFFSGGRVVSSESNCDRLGDPGATRCWPISVAWMRCALVPMMRLLLQRRCSGTRILPSSSFRTGSCSHKCAATPNSPQRRGQTQTLSATSVERKFLVQDHSGSLVIVKLATSAVESTAVAGCCSCTFIRSWAVGTVVIRANVRRLLR